MGEPIAAALTVHQPAAAGLPQLQAGGDAAAAGVDDGSSSDSSVDEETITAERQALQEAWASEPTSTCA